MLKLGLNIEEEEEAGGNDTEMPALEETGNEGSKMEETCNHTQLKKHANNTPLMAIPPIEEVFINSASSVCVLNSCVAERNLKFGRWIHAGVLKSGLALYNVSANEAISIFKQMLSQRIQPNKFTFAVLLQACGQTRNLKLAEMIHGNLIVNGLMEYGFLQFSVATNCESYPLTSHDRTIPYAYSHPICTFCLVGKASFAFGLFSHSDVCYK
ncbi:hypothetical protein NE237_020526 [Protea cynaroides]|uniref:Pentatricopeptide repeat-containing protein n=1 Tax=Protea cynaroides TaxID=273540 RepID=A0A9Q0K2E1_9MAGN|nr:hypothetical protein NE237_020526 [Protea cynaroides]